MPENEFEKKVSSELQQLRFKPSETVWVRVEERIRNKNRRRVFVIIFLLAGLALLGYWQRNNLFGEKKTDISKNEQQKEDDSKLLNKDNNSSTTIQSTETKKQNEITDIKETGSTKETTDNKTDKTAREKLITKEPSDIKIKNTVLEKKISLPDKKRDPSKPGKSKVDQNLPGKAQPKVDSISQHTISQPVNIITTDPNLKKDKPADQINNNLLTPNKPNEIKDVIDNKTQAPVKNTDEKIDKEEQKQDKTPEQKDKPAKQKTDSSKKDKKWYAGVNIQVGSSNTKQSKGLFSSQRERMLDYSSGVGGGGVSYDPTHEVRSRMSFGMGVFARKELSEKFYLNLGLNYSLLRTGLRVGRQIAATQAVSNVFSSNASINNFYRPPVADSNKTYNNNYHFLGLQSEIGWRFSNWPVTLNLGVEYSRLLGTNSLLYERRLPGFYQDKDAFVKNHLFISGGLSLRIAENKKYSFELNPFAEGSLTKLFRADTAQLHYTNFGLRLRIISKK